MLAGIRDRRSERELRLCTKLMVVAHPDDETFWGGATLAAEEGWGVICVTNRQEKARKKAFDEAMKILGATGIVLDLPDRRWEQSTQSEIDALTSALADYLSAATVKRVLTHSPDGETAHPFHILLSGAVTSLVDVTRLEYFNFSLEVDLARDAPDVWRLKRRAIDTYLGDEATWIDNDQRHVRLSRHECPVPASQYVRPTALLVEIYAGSSVPAAKWALETEE